MRKADLPGTRPREARLWERLVSASDEIWLAIGHVRAAKTKISDALHAVPQLAPAVIDVLRLERRELWKLELKLIQFAKSAQIAEAAVERRA